MSSNRNDKDPGALANGALANADGTHNPVTGKGAKPGGNGAAVGQSSASQAHTAKVPQALNRWFDDQLNQLFNDVSSEPLPPDLAKLIGQLKAQSQK